MHREESKPFGTSPAVASSASRSQETKKTQIAGVMQAKRKDERKRLREPLSLWFLAS